MRKVIRLKYALPGILLPFVILYFFFGSGQKPGKRLHDGSSCNNQLGSDQKTDLQKIASYKFPTSVEKNISALLKGVDTIPHLPAFVTAFDSSHYIEGQELIQGLSEVRKKYPDIKLYIFDLGLKPHHKEQLQATCRCTIQTFPFEKFPDHVHWMKGYAWKPLSIQTSAIPYFAVTVETGHNTQSWTYSGLSLPVCFYLQLLFTRPYVRLRTGSPT